MSYTFTAPRVCMVCNKNHTITTDASETTIVKGVKAWQEGEFIQNAMPFLSAEDREVLISGTGPECWNRMFPENED